MTATTEQNDDALLTTLEARVQALEAKHHACPADIVVDEQMRRARGAVESAHLYSAVWTWVPNDYYAKPLEFRQKCLGAPSIHHLCKSYYSNQSK